MVVAPSKWSTTPPPDLPTCEKTSGPSSTDAPVLVGFVAVLFFFAAAVVVSIFAVLDVLSVVVIVVVV